MRGPGLFGPPVSSAGVGILTWSGEELDLDAYLARIGYQGAISPDLETLRGLQRAHVASIPFENLEVAFGREVPLDLKSL